jgi:hypothetical protein
MKTFKQRYKDLPLGTRFTYDGSPNDVYVILSRAGNGTVARWEGPRGSAIQGIYTACEDNLGDLYVNAIEE